MNKMRQFVPVYTRFRPRIELRDVPGDEPGQGDVAGKVMGVACVYNAVDFMGTMFAPGCFDRTRSEKIPQGKVPLFRDHEHSSRSHVGVVRDCPDAGNAMMMSADCFNNDEGKQALEYCKSVLAADGFTGLSVGVYVRSAEWRPNPMAKTVSPNEQQPRDGGDKGDGTGQGLESPNTQSPLSFGDDDQPASVYTFTECELAEISITPLPAVPGAEVLHARGSLQTVRQQLIALRVLMTAVPRAELEAVAREFGLGEVVTPRTPDVRNAVGRTPTDSEVREAAATLKTVPLDERLAWIRQRYGRTLGV